MWRSLDIKVMTLDRHKNGSTRILNSTRLKYVISTFVSVMIVFLLRVMVHNKQILPYYKMQIIGFIDLATTLSIFMLSFKFAIQCRLFEWKRICAVLLISMFLCVWPFVIQCIKKERVVITLTYSTLPRGCACPDLNFQRHISRLFICSVSNVRADCSCYCYW